MNRRVLLSALPAALVSFRMDYADNLLSLLQRTPEAYSHKAMDPPASSSRMDLFEYAIAKEESGFIFFDDKARSPAGCAETLERFLIKANQPQQGWLLLGPEGVIAPQDYKHGTAVTGFAVTIGVSPIDQHCKPIGKPQPFDMSDLYNVNTISEGLATIFKGAPNSRCRAITYWVVDKGSGQVQSTNTPSKDQWTDFMRLGFKSAPVTILKGCEMAEPHEEALVYEFEKSPMEKTWTFKARGDDVQTHLKASGLWAPMGLK